MAALVFISYSSKHRNLTRALAIAIEAQYGPGSVWWDEELESRAPFELQIRDALEKARVVVVIWSTGATTSNFVYSEALYAKNHHKLVNVRPADVPFDAIPMEFASFHIDDLASTDRILATIAKVMRGTPVPTRVSLAENYWRHHSKRVLEEKQLPLPADWRSAGPSELLQAKYAVVDYDDASNMRGRVLAWCLSDGPTAARLVHGAGGVGKTRLMIEVAARLRQDHGWQAGFLEGPPENEDVARQRWQALDQLIAHGDGRGLLIVMDYAEARREEVKAIAGLLSRRPGGETPPIRLVLLARSAGEWWTTLHDETPDIRRLFRRTHAEELVTQLPPLSRGGQRRELFAASLAAFGPLLEAQGFSRQTAKPSPADMKRIETQSGYSRPLAIEMKALVWLTSAAPEAGAGDVEELLRLVLSLERTHWRNILGERDEERTRDLARAVAQVTAVQGTQTSESTERLLMADEFYKGRRTARVDVDRVGRSLARLYGRIDGGIRPLEPDLIGEHHVATVGDIELIEGCLRWIDSEPREVQQQRSRELLTVLQRATQSEHGAEATSRAAALLDHLIGAHADTIATAMVAVMIDTPGALAGVLVRKLGSLDTNALAALDGALPPQSLLLLDVSIKIATRRADLARHALTTADDKWEVDAGRVNSHLAARLGTLAMRLANLGRREEALATCQEAVGIYRTLAKGRPDAFLPDLAMSLGNLGAYLSKVERREEALATCHDAIGIYRSLAEDRPDLPRWSRRKPEQHRYHALLL